MGDDWEQKVTSSWPPEGRGYLFTLTGMPVQSGTIGCLAIINWEDSAPTTWCFLHDDPKAAYISAARFAGETYHAAAKDLTETKPPDQIGEFVDYHEVDWHKPGLLSPAQNYVDEIIRHGLSDEEIEIYFNVDLYVDGNIEHNIGATIYIRPIIF
jgi:hypothetical protein